MSTRDFEVAISLLSSLIAAPATPEVVVSRHQLMMEGSGLTVGWKPERLNQLACAVTEKFIRGGQYSYAVTYYSTDDKFVGLTEKERSRRHAKR